MVVGAGGWLGLATLELLHELLGEHLGGRVACFGSAARTLVLRGGVEIPQRPLDELAALPTRPTLVLHLAFLTQEKAKVMARDAYVEANRAISRRVLEALDRIGAAGLFLPSSGAVYCVDGASAEPSKQIYGSLKREDEDRFAGWGERSGAAVTTGRVFNLSGPYINKQSSYALACFIADALAARPIRIRSDRPVYRSYVAIAELMSIVFGALTAGRGERVLFDTAGDDVYEMGRMAEVVAEALASELGWKRPTLREGEIDRYVGDGAAYARLRQIHGVTSTGFIEQVRDTAWYMAQPAGAPSVVDHPGKPECDANN